MKSEYVRTRKDGRQLWRTFDEGGNQIQNAETGAVYDEAVDVDTPKSYVATEMPIIAAEVPAEEALAAILEALGMNGGDDDEEE